MFPASREGNTKTVALPATSEPGSFFSATALSTAASNWMGPSMASSGAFSRARRVASTTASTSGPEPDEPVE